MTMPALLLHHYDTSPFSEKIRKVFAHKRLAWGAVEQPSIMPKPELVPLTGGYRRIPVLQIGADVYCDTQCIVRVLERLQPEPTIYPEGGVATAHAWNLWADRLRRDRAAGPCRVHRGSHQDDARARLPRDPAAGAPRARAGARAGCDARG